MRSLATQVEHAADFISRRWPHRPRAGIILGTGLGELAGQIEVEATLDYGEIPHFLPSTATSHRGQLVCGRLAGQPVIVMQGRHHAYEGYPLAATTLPVRVMKALGAELLILSNAAGGMNPHYRAGDVMLIDDHINLMFASPLEKRGRSSFFRDIRRAVPEKELRPLSWARPYDAGLIEMALDIARRGDFAAHRGVYVAVLGPNLETRAEYRLFRRIGGDVVGMSTVPEAIVAAQESMRVLAISTVTNVCLPDALRPVGIDQIIATAKSAEPKVRQIIVGVLESLG